MSDKKNEGVCLTDHTAEFGDGTYRFWLPMPEMREFETAGSFAAFYYELSQAIGIDGDGKFIYTGGAGPNVNRVANFIRLALIGGNSTTIAGETGEVGPNRAKQLVETYCYPARPIEESAALAFNIAHALMYGNEAARAANAKAA